MLFLEKFKTERNSLTIFKESWRWGASRGNLRRVHGEISEKMCLTL